MILARFRYEGYILGEWTEVRPDGPMMVPNPGYAGRLLGVEFKETLIPAKEKRSVKAYHVGPLVKNGDCLPADAKAIERSKLITHLHTHPDHYDSYSPGHDFVLVSTADIRVDHERQHETIGEHDSCGTEGK